MYDEITLPMEFLRSLVKLGVGESAEFQTLGGNHLIGRRIYRARSKPLEELADIVVIEINPNDPD